MNTKVILFFAAVLVSGTVSASVSSEPKTGKFKVYGNCGMCENRIEQAAKTVGGVSVADWDKKTKVMTVTYDQSKTDIAKVHSAIAKAGHDTEMHRAGDEAYEKLHGCCKYKRTEMKPEGSGAENAVPVCPHRAGTTGCCGGSNS